VPDVPQHHVPSLPQHHVPSLPQHHVPDLPQNHVLDAARRSLAHRFRPVSLGIQSFHNFMKQV